MNPDETNREWAGGQWAGEESQSSEQGHWDRKEWVGDQTAGDTTSSGDLLPDDEAIPREDLGGDRPGGPSGMGHNPERSHWADTDRVR